jgi:hypothetical protein
MNSDWTGRLEITANDVKLNMNRKRIYGNYDGIGIFINSASRVKISNPDDVAGPNIYNFDYGIYVYNSPNCSLDIVGANSINYYGMLLENSSNPYLDVCTGTSCGYHGIVAAGCTDLFLTNGYTVNNGHSGTWFDNCDDAYISWSWSSGNTYYGHVQLNVTSDDFAYYSCWATGNGYEGFTANNADGDYTNCESTNSENSCGFVYGNGSSVDYYSCSASGNAGGDYCSW